MQVFVKKVMTVEVLCRKPDRQSVVESLQAQGCRIVADRLDRMAGKDTFPLDFWYVKGEVRLSETSQTNLGALEKGVETNGRR